MEQAEFERVLRQLYEAFLRWFNGMDPRVRDAVRAEWQALMAAIAAARASGVQSAGPALRAILEALKRLLAALTRVGWSSTGVKAAIARVEALIAELGAGAGLTAAAALLVLVAIVLVSMSIYEITLIKGEVDPPVGGPPCGQNNPIASGLAAEEYSHWGQRAAFKAAEASARAAAQEFTCQGDCETGKCRGNCIILDVSYSYRVFWTWCYIKYEVWCECY